jgi:hypothetical protein
MSDQPSFTGNADQKALAEQVFSIMQAQGAFFASDAPIRQTLGNLADFFASQRNIDRAQASQEIDEALQQNAAIFTREVLEDDEIIYVISRRGTYVPRQDVNTHMFKQRLYQPENPLPIDDISVVVTTTRPALTTVEPVFISDYWQQQAGILPIPSENIEVDDTTLVGLGEVSDSSIYDTIVTDDAIIGEPVEVEEPVAEVISSGSQNTLIALPNGIQIDLGRSVEDLMTQYGPTLVSQFRQALENDPLRRIVSFGNDTYPEASVANFGKNDLRRIRDYLMEVGEPLLDTQLIADIFYHNPRQADYEPFRFALNYRLNREKDFEFVGVQGARLWSTKGLTSIGGKRMKASDMGQIASYLEEDFDDSLNNTSVEEIREQGSITHVLSFFEWEYGILPLTKALATLLPAPMLADQRVAVLRFDSPLHYSSALVELRYPTGNRGGWLQGLEDFFHERLIPGSIITISRTEEPHVFALTYEEQAESTERLLVFDEKKNKFAFSNIAYYSTVEPSMLVEQQRFGRLRNLKALPMNERRKGDLVLEHVFAIIGEPVGTRSEPRYFATTEDLLVGLNVLRPASESYLEHLLKTGEYFEQDSANANSWYFNPPPKIDSNEDEDEDDEYFDDED